MELVMEGIANDFVEAFEDEAASRGWVKIWKKISYTIKDKIITFHFPDYAEYLEFGTGIYGPKGTIITPKTKKVLHWIDKDGKEIFASYTKGMTPQPFIRPTIHQKFDKIIADNINNR